MDPSMLTTELATEIAKETSEILGYRVLITDNRGLVIGSGEPDRIGTMHSPSVQVAATQLASSKTRAELPDAGVRPGITMPIIIEGTTIGTVGIAGPVRTVRKLGRLVQRQTEILLRESFSQRTRVLRENAATQLVRDIVMYDERVLEEGVLRTRASELGYDLSGDRVAIAIESRDGTGTRAPRAQLVRDAFANRQDIVAELPQGRCVVLHRLSRSADPARAPRQRLLERCRAAANTLGGRGTVVRIGIGGIGRGVAALAGSCADADSALRIGRKCFPAHEVLDIETVRMHQVLESVPVPARERYVGSQLSALRRCGDAGQLRSTVIAWCTSGFNLVRTAALLGVHRNTVVYRLDKISGETGADIRDPRSALPMYLACLAEELSGPDPDGG
ncbi:CdaR family transcriptional regulator [Sciscionella sediminilitoris]|uniref:CdaR family transcriptional regulator n=1 Tax=Sciscionella sediminilitoris TaxID=1445613 RepID=UPI00068B9D7D|nr:sugar diacid recognition domain-containing protein [Sciscionella sp. SE31]